MKVKDFKKEDFRMANVMTVIEIQGKFGGEYIFHDSKKDIYGNTLIKRKKDFIELITEEITKMCFKHEIQIPSDIPVNMIEKRILNMKKIPYTNIELSYIMNGIENIVKILDEEEKVIDTIKFNLKDEYYNTIKNMITTIDINKFFEGNNNE